MKNDRYGQYEQVNGGVANDLMDKLEASEKITRQVLHALLISKGQWAHSVNAERCLKAMKDAVEHLEGFEQPEKSFTATDVIKQREAGFKRILNDSVLISKDEWIERNCLVNEPQTTCFDNLWNEFNQVSRFLIKMADSQLDSPRILKTIESPDVIEQRVTLDKAIELLEACSEDLFITGEDKVLEDQVDIFLSTHRKDNGHYIGLDRLPSSLKEQAD